MPDKWDKYAAPDQPADKWAKYAEPEAPPQISAQPEESHPLRDFASNFIDAVNPIPGIKQLVAHPIDTAKNLVNAQGDQFREASHDLHDTREMPSVAGRLSSAFGHTVAGLLPLVGPAAAEAGEQIGNGDVAGGLGHGMGLIANVAAVPELVKGTGKLVRLPSEPLAKGALGIRGDTEAYGATPGKAILEETSGVRPGAIAKSARGRIGELSTELEHRAASSTTPARLTPARNVISTAIDKARAANSESTPNDLIPMRRQLTEPRPGFAGRTVQPPAPLVPTPSPVLGANGQPIVTMQPGPLPPPVIADTQSPSDLLAMKRQFNRDFVRNWNPAANTKGALGVARQAEHELGTEVGRTVPGGAALNQRISSLIPVAERARLTDLQAGPMDRVLNRMTRPTGGFLPILFGFEQGGVPGAALSIAGQETLGSPSARMIAARSLRNAGKGIASPLSQRAAQILPLVNEKNR